jgi:hypothetical protein
VVDQLRAILRTSELKCGYEGRKSEQKFNRLRDHFQDLILQAYPNPGRDGCRGGTAVTEYARRAAAWDKIEGEPDYEHIIHCSPCYREFLDAREQIRAEEVAKPARRMSWFKQRRLGRSLDRVEQIMESAAQEL